MTIRFDNRVAIVTGAGNGLGREHALGLAKRGAKVVVNDFGGARDGTGGSSAAADKVVDEIKAAGGEAIAAACSVTDEAGVKAMVDAAMSKWGKIDILINNAGILRDKTFTKMELADFRTVLDVHLMGTVICTKAVWDIMRAQNYGRIVFTVVVLRHLRQFRPGELRRGENGDGRLHERAAPRRARRTTSASTRCRRPQRRA